MDHDLIKRNIAKAHDLIEEGGDWDRRNRLKVYKGICYNVKKKHGSKEGSGIMPAFVLRSKMGPLNIFSLIT